MGRLFYCIIILIGFACCLSGSSEKVKHKKESVSSRYLDSISAIISHLYDSLGTAQPGEWLYSHKEKLVSFDEYRKSSPVRPDSIRKIIFIQPFSDLDSSGMQIVKIVSEYMQAFYGLETKTLPVADISSVPEDYRRVRNGKEQLKTTWLLDNFLVPSLPPDGVVIIGLTSYDLYPKDSWNFVFGQAYLKQRAGVWSIARLCDRKQKKDVWNNCIPRTLKTASHETGHMFSITHCIQFKCAMNGSNSLEESDDRPVWLCPDCLKKFSWNLQREPKEHLKQLMAFWKKYGDKKAAAFYEKNLKALGW